MTTIKAFITKHPVPTYYAPGFAISWAGVLWIIGGPGRIPGTPEEIARLFPVACLATVAGPSLAGILLVAMLMHASLDFFWLISTPAGIAGGPLATWYLAWAALLLIVVAAVAVTDRGHLVAGEAGPQTTGAQASRQLLRRRAVRSGGP
jgi:hypothetical protein